MVKYSVIIPVYNSEKTIARCLQSLTSQGRKDVQIIVVNDGSTDSSENIILDFAAKIPEVEYIHQENSGVSCARNTGLEHAVGTYILFVDSDDYVTSNYFDVLDKADDCDLLVFAHDTVGGVPLDETGLFSVLQAAESVEARLNLLLSSRKIMSPCNKRFRTDLIRSKSISFLPNMHIGEDFNFCMAFAVCCQSLEITGSKILCVDISDQSSLSRKYRPELDHKIKTVFEQIATTISSSSLNSALKEQLLATSDYLFIKHVFSCIIEEFKQRRLHYFKDRKQIVSICKKFQWTVSDQRVNLIHCMMRLVLACHFYYPFYFVAYWAKGRKYLH